MPDTTGERLLGFIRQYIADHGYSPTLREMCDGAAIKSTSVANHWMRTLRDDGLITWVDHQARTVRLVGDVSPSDPAPSTKVLRH